MKLSLKTPPAGVQHSVWTSSSSRRPAIGDLWLLSWNNQALELGVISTIQKGFILMWPVTLHTEFGDVPALNVRDTPLGVSLNIWPTRLTGVGNHLLHRNYGSLFSEKFLQEIRKWADHGGIPPLPVPRTAGVSEQLQREFHQNMLLRWSSICEHTWPEEESSLIPFDPIKLNRTQISFSTFAEVLNCGRSEARALFKGDQIPTKNQIRLLTDFLQVDMKSVLTDRQPTILKFLLDPKYKSDLLEIAALKNISEFDARSLVQRQYALAARSARTERDRFISVLEFLKASRV